MKYIISMLLIFCSFSSLASTNGKWVFDSLSYVEKNQIEHSFAYLLKRDVRLSVRSIYNKYNIDSSKGENLYSLVFRNFKTVIGESAETKICSLDGTGNGAVPKCGKNGEGLTLKKPSLIYMPESYFAVWDIKRDLDRFGIKSGAYVLSEGGVLNIDSKNSKILIYLSSSVDVDGEILAIKITTESFGYSLVSELMNKGIPPFSRCSYLRDKYDCQDGNLGYFEPVGDLQLDMAGTCITCSDSERLEIKFWALNNLSRFKGPEIKMDGIFMNYIKLRKEMKEEGMDNSFLERRYRQNLSGG